MIAMVMTYDGMIGRRNVGCCFRVWMGFMKHSMHGVYQTGQDWIHSEDMHQLDQIAFQFQCIHVALMGYLLILKLSFCRNVTSQSQFVHFSHSSPHP
jgi:hypothetical protein